MDLSTERLNSLLTEVKTILYKYIYLQFESRYE